MSDELDEKRRERERRRSALRVLDGGGGGTQPPDMENRIAALEADMKDVKAGIGRLEVASARVEATVGMLATKADVALTTGKVAALEARGNSLEIGLADLGRKVDAKLVSGGQMFGIFAGLVMLFFALGGIAVGLLRYFGLLH